LNDLNGLGGFNPDTFQRLRLAKGCAAFDTLEPLNDPIFILESPEPSGFSLTASTVHLLPLPREKAKVSVYLPRYARPLAQPRGFAPCAVLQALHGALLLFLLLS
jgi:hypothetical protein